MKNNANNAMNTNQNEDQLTAQQLAELENDTVWTLLENVEKASPVEASPMFARNAMRKIRLSEGETGAEATQSFWQRVFAPKMNKVVFAVGATAACAALAFTMMSEQNANISPITANSEFLDEIAENLSMDELADIDEAAPLEAELDSFTDEMLDLASQDPFYISEEEIEIAMQM